MIKNSASSSDRLFGHFLGKKSNVFLTILYFLAFYPVVLVYGISLINTIENYLTSHMHQPTINRAMLSFVCITALFSVVTKGRDRVVRTMGVLALPFALSIMTIAVAMIPQWDHSLLTQQLQQLDKNTYRISIKEIWLSLPLITFSFGCAPIILPLALYYQQKKEEGKSCPYGHIPYTHISAMDSGAEV
ncbi:tryptophan/tyrosine permease family protein [Rahnella sp. BIGb0236]|nr:tryptophan/tyrosine permease family protein [Rahnella sp. BIGb0236]